MTRQPRRFPPHLERKHGELSVELKGARGKEVACGFGLSSSSTHLHTGRCKYQSSQGWERGRGCIVASVVSHQCHRCRKEGVFRRGGEEDQSVEKLDEIRNEGQRDKVPFVSPSTTTT